MSNDIFKFDKTIGIKHTLATMGSVCPRLRKPTQTRAQIRCACTCMCAQRDAGDNHADITSR